MWFYAKCIPQENNLSPKATLLLNNAATHPNAEQLRQDGNICGIFFRPSVMYIAPQMGPGVIETIKRLYRKDLKLQLLIKMLNDWAKENISLKIKEVILWTGSTISLYWISKMETLCSKLRC